jgi:hypothetical protein
MEESRRGGDPRRAAWMHGREIPVNLDDACAFDGYEARARVEAGPGAVRGRGRGASVSLGRFAELRCPLQINAQWRIFSNPTSSLR